MLRVDQCMFCRHTGFHKVFEYEAPPKGETSFSFLNPDRYHRNITTCKICGHFYSIHEMDLSAIYSGAYNRSTYQNPAGMRQTFDRITQLDSSKSDNTARCNRIVRFLQKHNFQQQNSEIKVLDVGSGLGVFPWAMAHRGYAVTALDPDPNAAEHIRTHAGVPTLCGDFLAIAPPEGFSLITFNKVLEHVAEPIAMLRKSALFLKEKGVVYLELPDGEKAQVEGFEREEFFIDHFHVFSFASIALLASLAGFEAIEIERLREPSGKFTLLAFLIPRIS